MLLENPSVASSATSQAGKDIVGVWQNNVPPERREGSVDVTRYVSGRGYGDEPRQFTVVKQESSTGNSHDASCRVVDIHREGQERV